MLAAVAVLRPSWLIRGLLAPLVPEVLFCAGGGRRELALTIDDGPTAPRSGAPSSLELLALLRELQLPATFFLIGEHLRRGDAGFVRAALADGHGIGNHMDRDGVSACLRPQPFREQFEATDRELRRRAGSETLELRWFRPGGGWFHPRMLRSVKACGRRLVLGSVFPWDTVHPPLDWMVRFVLANVHPGAILVLHDRPDTLDATLALLRAVVPELRRRGYRFVSLDRLQTGGDPSEPSAAPLS
ncbi:MAG: hypothetical protein RLZZ219_1246 [Cyanobacteriota bacterium]